MKQKGAKIMAILALIAILGSILGTGIGMFMSSNSINTQELTPEQIAQIQELINSQSGSTTSTGELNGSGITIETNN